ncbi:MAG: TetR/AcrR family transcriptional regulator [Thermodesulfobacteriota bacterium]
MRKETIAAPARAPVERAAPVRPLPARDEQAEERRRQLVRIASDLIEEGGVDAVTLPRVTERAGCARTLVYRYFASREELLLGVLRDYFERLDARLPEPEQRRAVDAMIRASRRDDPASVHALIAVFWDVQAAAGFGGAILRALPHLSAQIQALVEDCRERYERRFTDPLRAAGLSEVESRTAMDLMIASFVALARLERAGGLDRGAAIDLHARATVGLVRGLLRRVRAARGRRRGDR